MNNPIYYGPFKDTIRDFIDLKQSLGYQYTAEAKHLRRFDTFTVDHYPEADFLSKEIVMQWCSKKSYEKQNNLCSRASMIRQFAYYLDSIDLKPYIIPRGYFKEGESYIPYIFTENELSLFFRETRKCHYCSQSPYRHFIMPLIFKMIYSCGLRVSEARLLKVGDVDLDRGILSILHSKNDNSRLIPMSDSITADCRRYSAEIHANSVSDQYYFPVRENTPLTRTNLYHNFRKFLWKAGISHHGRGFGPRIHDFRHTFSVHRLKKWSEEGKDLMTFLPVLRTYLGHDSFEETAYYLRLTADVYPEIIIKLETLYSSVIPSLRRDENE